MKDTKALSNNSGTSATLYVRVPRTLHRRARVRAITDGLTLAQVIEAALSLYLKEATDTTGAGT